MESCNDGVENYGFPYDTKNTVNGSIRPYFIVEDNIHAFRLMKMSQHWEISENWLG